jgi:mono/diheme cytochrome c family protein
MISKNSLRFITGAVIVATAVACSRKATVGSPGTTASPAPAAANRAPAMPAGVTAATIAEGKTLYEAATSNCGRCHGVDAKGTNRGPNLSDSTWAQIDGSYPEIARIINEGVPAAKIKGGFQFPMRPKANAPLTDAQVNSIAAYLWSLSHAH